MDMQSVSIIGIGRIGGALAVALSRRGFNVERLIHRGDSTLNRILSHLPSTVSPEKFDPKMPAIESDVVVIATADPDIESAAAAFQEVLKPGRVVLHTSGSLSSGVLSSLESSGHFTGSMHPLISISDAVVGAGKFSGAYFCIEGDARALLSARSIVGSLGGHPFSIPSDRKSLYHASAVTACGHVVALIDVAVEMLTKCGIGKDEARKALRPLIDSTVENLRELPPEKALTGSFARLDIGAVERHVAAIRSEMSEAVLDLYLLLGERSLDLAVSDGADTGKVQKLRDLISIAKRKAG